MVSAVKKKPKPHPKHVVRSAGKTRQKTVARKVDPLADIDEPDRSSPCLAEVDGEALEFIAAIDRFKKENGRPFPSWSEILLVLRELGYRRS